MSVSATMWKALPGSRKRLGLQYAGCAWIPHSGQFDEKSCREAAAVFNKAGEALAKHGIKFFYHTHGFEFVPRGSETLFDLLMAETKPEYVTYEMDIFWVVHGGQDPEKLFDKYGDRFALVHLKDMKKGTPINLLTGGDGCEERRRIRHGADRLSAGAHGCEKGRREVVLY